MKRAKRARIASRRLQTRKLEPKKLPFIEHVYELRKRLFYVAASVALFSLVAYSIERSVISWLLKPAGGQHFIYTSPIGGLDFLFRVCIYIGIAASIPIIVYQCLRYVEPLLKDSSMRFITLGSLASGILALIGLSFGYFVGLPAALHFLLHQFVFTKQIQPLITIQSYMSFVGVYMFGSALLFQIPLLLILINRIKPLKPKKLLSLQVQRWVILGAFIGGGIMNPNPNLLDQVVIVGPLILMYELGVAIIWFGQRKHRRPQFLPVLLEHDSKMQAVRQKRFSAAREAWQQNIGTPEEEPLPATLAKADLPEPAAPKVSNQTTVTAIKQPARQATRPIARRFVNDVSPVRPYSNLNRRISPDAA